MKPNIYANLEQLSYGELLSALNNIKEHEQLSPTVLNQDVTSYKDALMMELDKRQKEI